MKTFLLLLALVVVLNASTAFAQPSVRVFKKFPIGSGPSQIGIISDDNSTDGPQGIFWKGPKEFYILDSINHRLIEMNTGRLIRYSGIDFGSDLFILDHSILVLGNISQKISVLDRSGKTRACIQNASTEPLQTSLLVSDGKEIHLNKNTSAEKFAIPSTTSKKCSVELGEPLDDITYSFVKDAQFGSVKIEANSNGHVLKINKNNAAGEIQAVYPESLHREFQFLGFDKADRFYIVRYEFGEARPMKTFLDQWSSSGDKKVSMNLKTFGVFAPQVFETTRTFTLDQEGHVYALVPTKKDVKVLKMKF